MSYFLAIDVGGHNIRCLLTDPEGNILVKKTVSTLRDAKTATQNLEEIAGLIEVVQAEARLTGNAPRRVCIGVPGPVDNDGLLITAPNVPHWENIQIRDFFQSRLGAPVLVENDVNLAAAGEYWKGAASGCQTFVFVAVGTGIGGGVFVNGRLVRGRTYNAGEIGYLVLAPNQRERRMGDLGWFESVASGLALDVQAESTARSHPASVLATIGGKPERTKAIHLFQAAGKGDGNAQKVLDEAFEYMAMAVCNMTALLDPDVFVFGGGMSRQGEDLLGPIRERASDYGLPIPPLKLSELGEEAQLYGAVYHAISPD